MAVYSYFRFVGDDRSFPKKSLTQPWKEGVSSACAAYNKLKRKFHCRNLFLFNFYVFVLDSRLEAQLSVSVLTLIELGRNVISVFWNSTMWQLSCASSRMYLRRELGSELTACSQTHGRGVGEKSWLLSNLFNVTKSAEESRTIKLLEIIQMMRLLKSSTPSSMRSLPQCRLASHPSPIALAAKQQGG